ncbi:hypothetical protein X275_00760 [Marinitoga sp. 1197]|uniref:PQQ-binding-like beta-propeller repeat protein n=1 Tax=Marinitoga sp. 1197 TaxID=1428449 RepID=UPI000659C338|nr:PQQ-binding-like beta-propeller repeat protein [Marinitoga sp. 1197]KLO24248.1 hypothetical protein X275_00760 [Marinitoga sp. 1197]
MKKIIMMLILITLILSGCVTNNNAPSKALEVYPINYSEGIPLNITLKWIGYDEEDKSNLYYDVYMGKSKDNLNLMEYQITKNEYHVLGLEPTTTYYWKIDSIDSRGELTEGDIWEFKTKENTPPTTPEIIEPENGAENVILNPILKWKSIDIDGHNIKYDIYFGENKNNLKLIAKDYEDSKYKIEGLDVEKTYYWEIIAKDEYGGIAESTIANFTTTSSLLKWKFKTEDRVLSSPAIGADGTIYIGSYDNYLYAINPDGSLKWKYKTNGVVASSPTVGIDGSIYVGNSDGYIYAINYDGSLKWKFETNKNISTSPAIGIDGTIYVSSDDGYIYAITFDGFLKWKYLTYGYAESSPSIGYDGIIYVGSDDNYVYAINPDGSLKWKYKTNGDVKSSPAIGKDGIIYVGSDDNYVYAINPDGSLKWKYKTDGDVESSPAIGKDGAVFVGSLDNYVYAINPDGSLKWKFRTADWVKSSPAIGADGTVFVGSLDNYVYAINPDGSLKWKFRTADWVKSSPAIGADGTIYIGSKDGHIYAINGNNGGLADTPWPMFHANPQHTGRVDEDNYLTSEIILNEDFENIDLGKIPKEFSVLYSGRSYGVVQDENIDASGNKFLKVWGQPGWCCGIVFYFDIFKYQKIELNYKVYASNKEHIGWIAFINPDVSWGWICGGANIWDNGNIRFVTDKNEEIKVKVYNINSWNDVKTIFFPNEKYGKVYINNTLIYEYWINDDGYSSKIKVYLPDNKTIEYTAMPKSEYRDPNAYKGLKGIRIGDCPGNDDIPTYFDDFVIIGYK